MGMKFSSLSAAELNGFIDELQRITGAPDFYRNHAEQEMRIGIPRFVFQELQTALLGGAKLALAEELCRLLEQLPAVGAGCW